MGVLRLLLALAVISEHSTHFLPSVSGGEAVSIFFVISGFYMALIQPKYPDKWIFYSNRYLRLYPTYAVVALMTAAWFCVIWLYTKQKPPPFWVYEANSEMHAWQWLLLQFSNLTMIGLDIPSMFHWKAHEGFRFMHAGANVAPDGSEWAGWMPWVRQAWSVGAEIWFYMLAPFILRTKTWVVAIVALGSFGLWVGLPAIWPLTYFFFPANLWLFLSGAMLNRFYSSTYFRPVPLLAKVASLGVAILTCSVGLVENHVAHDVAVVMIALSIPWLFNEMKSVKWDVFLGKLSYPVYMVHILALSVADVILHTKTGVVSAVLSLAAGLLIVHLLEDPLDKYRQSRAAKIRQVGANAP